MQSTARGADGRSGILLLQREENDNAVPLPRRSHNHRVEPPHPPLSDHMFRCRSCRQTCNERTCTPINYPLAPTDVAVLVAPGYMQDKLSLRNVAEMLLTRGFSFTHETEWAWEERLAPLLTAR